MNREAAGRVAAMAQARYPTADVTVTGVPGGAIIDVRDGAACSLRLTVGDERSVLLAVFGILPDREPDPPGGVKAA